MKSVTLAPLLSIALTAPASAQQSYHRDLAELPFPGGFPIATAAKVQ
jgi:hypothetical protein